MSWSKYATSIHRIERVLLSIPWHLASPCFYSEHIVYQGIQILNESFDEPNAEIVSNTSFFVYRYRIEVWLFIGIASDSILVRCYFYPTSSCSWTVLKQSQSYSALPGMYLVRSYTGSVFLTNVFHEWSTIYSCWAVHTQTSTYSKR